MEFTGWLELAINAQPAQAIGDRSICGAAKRRMMHQKGKNRFDWKCKAFSGSSWRREMTKI